MKICFYYTKKYSGTLAKEKKRGEGERGRRRKGEGKKERRGEVVGALVVGPSPLVIWYNVAV